ncbi:T9SS type A sorting domain-containing protein [Chryseobacterium binzhouense]|uniref:T9SS type A sorting domain-containing protein n=1 Tax=Chryseobacterium binzhouense TaxID=2593646 RepID=UPI001E511739|nr:T9SS type A sorting domain-containing protein [Chryseobacterium binzhouense]
MGGATEDDNAMKWFLQRANGGDILILRTTGSNGYNSYFYSGLGIPVNSVETIVCNNSSAGYDPYIVQKIQQAEAIWFAGGDQWTYISYWRNTPVSDAINHAIQHRNIAIGGTSAGMAILGKYYFSAQNGTVSSATALSNPFNNAVTVDSAAFLNNSILNGTITDTHFDNPDRKGRLMTFLARIKTDYGVYAKAIACDEYTAVCIDNNGIARVFGGYPTYDDNAYFIQSNCGLSVREPENCTTGNPLTWNLNGLAIKAYKIKGNSLGNGTFNLNTWQSGIGGEWYDWSVTNGIFSEQTGVALNCSPLSVAESSTKSDIEIYPNPTSGKVKVTLNIVNGTENTFCLYNTLGQKIEVTMTKLDNIMEFDISDLSKGLYYLSVYTNNGKVYQKRIIKN